jgi:hypothetical protein
MAEAKPCDTKMSPARANTVARHGKYGLVNVLIELVAGVLDQGDATPSRRQGRKPNQVEAKPKNNSLTSPNALAYMPPGVLVLQPNNN